MSQHFLLELNELSLGFWFKDRVEKEGEIVKALLELRQKATPTQWEKIWSAFEREASHYPKLRAHVAAQIQHAER
ncbi:MAG TPA: hypothetical protein VKR06_09030 [Ktedonosporobacter sp.]|nr:hypothetical protein [Ktedonosporobacter sp.]